MAGTPTSQPDATSGAMEPESAPGWTVVCGVDQSEECRRALRLAAALVERLDSRLVMVTVRPSPEHIPPGVSLEGSMVREQAVAAGQRLLRGLGEWLLDELGAEEPLERIRGRVEFGDPAARLAAVADEVDADLIAVGARGRSLAGSLFLGSVSQTLASEPSRPLLVVSPEASVDPPSAGPDEPRPSIVCGIDGSLAATSAARVAGRLASALGLRLLLVHVDQDGEEIADGAIDFEARLDPDTRQRLRLAHRAAEAAGGAEVEVCLSAGRPAATLAELATRQSAELIAVGTRGHGALRAVALGSVSRRLAASAPRPVLIANER